MSVTGSVVQVSSAELQKAPSSNLLQCYKADYRA